MRTCTLADNSPLRRFTASASATALLAAGAAAVGVLTLARVE